MRLVLLLLLGAIATGCAAPSRVGVTDNPVLTRLYAEDQADTQRSVIDLSTLPPGMKLPPLPPEMADDMARQAAVDSILAADGAQTANDFYHAAMVKHHGTPASRILEAHELTAQALALDPDHTDARWLFAASRDRYLSESGEPQWYGTQYTCDADGRRRSSPIESGAVTDADRIYYDVPTLAEQQALEGTDCGNTD